MNVLRVKISPEIATQIDDLTLHIAKDSVTVAMAWENRLRAAIKSLGHTYGFAIDEDATRRCKKRTFKYVFERTYLIFYTINESAGIIEIAGIRHGARLPRNGEP